MSKILSVQDIHVSPAWIEESKADIENICKVALKNKVDAITIGGDFFHRSVMASDTNKWNEILELARSLHQAAPVYFITGTPSHDAPGCYDSFKDIGWQEVTIGKSHDVNDVLIMGIPEITPAILMAQYPDLSKQEINEKQYELVNTIIDNYYAPLSKEFSGSVHFMAHGHVSGAKYRDDQKPRTSEFMYSEQLLERIGADYYQFGHIHLEQEFKTINGAYGGSAHITWNDVNFDAGFDIIEYGSGDPDKTRYLYKKCRRQKLVLKNTEEVFKLPETIKNDVPENTNLWIDIICDKEYADNFDIKGSLEHLKEKFKLGPLSKITLNIQHIEHARIGLDEYEKCSTVEELFKLYLEDASKSMLIKVREAESATASETGHIEQHTFEFLDLYLKGSKPGLENGVEEIKLDWKHFVSGANLITGANGTGKSFSLGFCTPFSEHIPSGADFKDLFELKDSQIIRRWKRDDKNIITQKIVIDPTLASPSVKYFMDIDGTPCEGVTGLKKPFDASVFNVFGTMEMFIACAFRGQKENKKIPNLQNAKEGDLRQIFTELSGTDRTPLKKYSHDKAAQLKRDNNLDLREIETLTEMVQDTSELNQIIKTNTDLKHFKNERLLELTEELHTVEGEFNSLDKKMSENSVIGSQISELEKEKSESEDSIKTLQKEIFEIDNYINDNATIETDILLLEKAELQIKDLTEDLNNKSAAFNSSTEQWFLDKELNDEKLQEITDQAELKKGGITTLQNDIDMINVKIQHKTEQIKNLNTPCEFCNELPSASQEQIPELKAEIEQFNKNIDHNISRIDEYNKNIEDYKTQYRALRASLSGKPKKSKDLTDIEIKISGIIFDKNKLATLREVMSNISDKKSVKLVNETTLKSKNQSIHNLSERLTVLNRNLTTVDNELYIDMQTRVTRLNHNKTAVSTEIGSLSAKIQGSKELLVKNDELHKKIDIARSRLNKAKSDISEWEIIEGAFAPKGIPAMELSLLAPIIDREANRLLGIYGGRFKTQIITQDLDSTGKNLVEKFKILVHDSMANEVKNLPVMSGGQAVWITKALQEAIAMVASQRSGRTWLYSIMDEADAALDSEIIPVFYSMMENALNGKRKLVAVTHSSEAKECVASIKKITDFFVGYGS